MAFLKLHLISGRVATREFFSAGTPAHFATPVIPALLRFTHFYFFFFAGGTGYIPGDVEIILLGESRLQTYAVLLQLPV